LLFVITARFLTPLHFDKWKGMGTLNTLLLKSPFLVYKILGNDLMIETMTVYIHKQSH
jgi:hypothetical protein